MIDIDYYIIEKYGSVEHFQEIYDDADERFEAKTDMLIDFCDEYEDIVIPVSPIYSMLDHNRIIDELWDCYKFNLTANENEIFKRVG